MKNKSNYLKIAHRGASGYEPDNTIRAYEKAINMGVDMIELDVHLCQEKIPIIIHDAAVQGDVDKMRSWLGPWLGPGPKFNKS